MLNSLSSRKGFSMRSCRRMKVAAPASPMARGISVMAPSGPDVVRPLIPRVSPPNIMAHVTNDATSKGILLMSTMSTMLTRVIANDITAMISGR